MENIAKTPNKHEIHIWLDHFYNGKLNLHSGTNTIRRIKEKISWQRLTKMLRTSSKSVGCQKAKTYRKYVHSPLVTKTMDIQFTKIETHSSYIFNITERPFAFI